MYGYKPNFLKLVILLISDSVLDEGRDLSCLERGDKAYAAWPHEINWSNSIQEINWLRKEIKRLLSKECGCF